MFKHLVESGSHAKDFKRRGSFLAGAILFYAVVLLVAGVGSIYAYNVRLDEREELEVLALMVFPPQAAAPESEPRAAETRPAAADNKLQVAKVTEIVKITPYATQVAKTNAPVLPKHVPFILSNTNEVPANFESVGPVNPNAHGVGPTNTRGSGPVVEGGEIEAPPARTPKVEPAPRQETPQVVKLPSSILIGKTISKPVPVYPVIAKQARIQGTVPVQILIDEQGQVVSAQATGGPAMLQQAAVAAARRARFTPTILTGRAVKVSGVILYNFLLN